MLLLSFALACLYIFVQAFYVYHWKKLKKMDAGLYNRNLIPVSIIVAARNEEMHIADCLASLMEQSYPEELLEVVVVDDHSDDRTFDLVAGKSSRIKPFSLGQKGMDGGKKNALRYGISQSSGDWIITVDADCILHPEAVSSSVGAYLNKGYKLVTGPVLIEAAETQLEYFQSYELAGLMLITGSGYQSGWHALANGAFLSFERIAYDAVQADGLQEQFASGDDMFLAEAIEARFPGSTGFLKDQNVRAVTHAEPGWNSFLRQRLRWASKNRHLKNRKIDLIWGFQWGYGLSLCITLVGSILHPGAWLPVLLVLVAGKLTGDLLLLRTAFTFFRMKFSTLRFLASEFFQVAYVLMVGFWVLSGGGTYRWKGRRVQ